jgi:hypothetical protein
VWFHLVSKEPFFFWNGVAPASAMSKELEGDLFRFYSWVAVMYSTRLIQESKVESLMQVLSDMEVASSLEALIYV